MSKLILQNIADDISFDSLPIFWRESDLKNFSKEKTLYDFQQEALKNALTILWKYYDDKFDFQEKEKLEVNNLRKNFLYQLYQDRLKQDFSYDLAKKEGKKVANLLKEGYYPVVSNKIGFENFINRMAFWMATGSGKTLVIVKLIELFKKLIENKEIPANDILFLTYREDLLDQFKEYIREFNASHSDIFINLKSLKDYDTVKRDTQSLFRDKEITIFYYRSDLISDESKEKIVDFRNYDNDGRWYILLDEAHKGDKEESKRQILYSILSRNGFLFNFSATFTDPRDFITTVYNFNLANFIEKEYGKNIYLSQEEIKAFREKEKQRAPQVEIEKQKIVLRSLVLLSYIRKFVDKVKKIDKGFYHYPLLLTLVNSVDVEDADLKLFFKTLEDIGHGEVKENLLNEVKKGLLDSFEVQKIMLMPEGQSFELDKEVLLKINFQDILADVFNSKSSGSIEVLTIPGNKQEMVFKLHTSEKPFALIKIGNISKWLKETLEGYEINESYDNESIFKKINQDDSDINILMGSRTFYEGWDSNRPNIILYINIGIGADAKKFVLQSVGRGVRIEPIKNERKRLISLYTMGVIGDEIYRKIQSFVLSIETLFVFGTSAKALEETLNILKSQKPDGISLEGRFEINKQVKDLPLYIPVYKLASYTFAEREKPQKFPISSGDLLLSKNYFEYLEDDRIFLMNFDADVKTLKAIKDSFQNEDEYYKTHSEVVTLNSPTFTLWQIVRHFSLVPEEFERFKKIKEGEDIVHFKKVRFSLDRKFDEFIETIEKVKNYQDKEQRIEQLQLDFEKKKISAKELVKKIDDIQKIYVQEKPFDGIKIKYVPHHYYIPIILSDGEKIEYLNHIINVKSEVEFIEKLERYLEKEDNLFNQFEWWAFSKIDQTTDHVFIPWYNPKTHSVEHYHPDFIFWLKRKNSNNYYIAFIDPHGIEHTEYLYKVDWYKKIFEGKVFDSQKYGLDKKFQIKVHLFLFTKDTRQLSEDLRRYWFDDIEKALRGILTD